MPIQISNEKAVELIIYFISKGRSEYYYGNVEKILLDKGIIYDCVPFSEFCGIIANAKPELLTTLIEQI